MPGRKQGSSQGDDATPAKKQGGFRIGTISIGGSGIRRTDPNTVSCQLLHALVNCNKYMSQEQILWHACSHYRRLLLT